MEQHSGLSSRIQWLGAPAVADAPPGHAVASAFLRMVVGLLWLYNVAWKRPPSFGMNSGSGLYKYTQDAVDHPVFAPYSWVVHHLVLPNFTVFGYGVLVVETSLAVLLLTGTYVRLAALLGILQSLAIGLSVAKTPGEWPWSYWLLIALHVAILFSAAGQVLAVDGVRAGRGWRPLARTWGVVLVLAGSVAVLLSLGDSFFAASGSALGGSGLSISLGVYNLAGGVVLILVGAGILAIGAGGNVRLGLASAVLATAAAVVVYVQIGFSANWLGGTNTSAAFFLSAAVVGFATWGQARARPALGQVSQTVGV